jgi:hypothetical protein
MGVSDILGKPLLFILSPPQPKDFQQRPTVKSQQNLLDGFGLSMEHSFPYTPSFDDSCFLQTN